jgi:hypothetical protein
LEGPPTIFFSSDDFHKNPKLLQLLVLIACLMPMQSICCQNQSIYDLGDGQPHLDGAEAAGNAGGIVLDFPLQRLHNNTKSNPKYHLRAR